MVASLNAIPRKRIEDMPPPALAGISYPECARVAEAMAARDARVIFDTMRPVGDEFWNLIDGRRTIADIAEALCMQFDVDVDAELFIPIAELLILADFITLDETRDRPTSRQSQ